MEATRIERRLSSLHGRIRDVDGHEITPARMWVSEFGEISRPFADLFIKNQPEEVPNSLSVRRQRDDGPINAETLGDQWTRGGYAEGAFDMEQRVRFMDVAGIRDTFLFGTAIGLTGWQLATGTLRYFEQITGLSFGDMSKPIGVGLMKAHNDWCVRTAAVSPRLRPVATVVFDDIEAGIAEVKRLLDEGIRGISTPESLPINGRAPCHPDNDHLWRLLADNDIPLLFHVGGEPGFLANQEVWLQAPLFTPNLIVVQQEKKGIPKELTIDPMSFASNHLAVVNYLSNLVLGGVFERVPNLRVGVLELGAHWVGSMAHSLDLWLGQFARRYKGVLSMKPSEYVWRNIRVSPFNFEPVGEYLHRYPELADVLCFSTDYPHFEGGPEPIRTALHNLERYGDEVIEKYFVQNAQWIMPTRETANDVRFAV